MKLLDKMSNNSQRIKLSDEKKTKISKITLEKSNHKYYPTSQYFLSLFLMNKDIFISITISGLNAAAANLKRSVVISIYN